MKIVVDDKIPFIRGKLEALGAVEYLSPDGFTAETVRDADALVIRTRTRVDAKLLSGSKVRFVVTATIGTDHIDLDWCAANGVEVRNCAGCNAAGVAQYVWRALDELGFDPKTQTLGIVGYGHVGQIVADWGRQFGCRIMVCDPLRKDAGHGDEDYRELEEILESCDAVTLHTPLTRGGYYPTHHMIGERELSMLKPGAVLINSARGPVVDNTALADALSSPCRGLRAVLDVWEGEPALDRELLDAVSIGTPHIAGYSRQGKERATAMVLEHFRELTGSDECSNGSGVVEVRRPGTLEDVRESYDIMGDDRRLREHPERFEQLRSDYDYRDEPGFNQ